MRGHPAPAISSTTIFDAVTKSCPAGGGAESGSLIVNTFTARIEAGTTTVLLGSSGCGKMTLLRMVNRMVEPSGGRALIDDENIATHDAVALRRSTGYVIQNVGLLLHRRVTDNITLIPRLQDVNRHDARCRTLRLIDILDLDRDLAERHPHQLFGGQTQRVGVARTLATDPEVLLMDEPFGTVDPLMHRDLQHEMARVQAELGGAIVFVTHDVDGTLALGDEIILLREGAQVVQRGSSPQLLADPADDFIARFPGLDGAARQLQLTGIAGSRVILDRAGRAVGHLADESSPGTEEWA